VRLAVNADGILIEGEEQELTDLASAILEAAVLGRVEEHLLTDDGIATVRIRRTDPDPEA
jgi:hypothetical protein